MLVDLVAVLCLVGLQIYLYDRSLQLSTLLAPCLLNTSLAALSDLLAQCIEASRRPASPSAAHSKDGDRDKGGPRHDGRTDRFATLLRAETDRDRVAVFAVWNLISALAGVPWIGYLSSTQLSPWACAATDQLLMAPLMTAVNLLYNATVAALNDADSSPRSAGGHARMGSRDDGGSLEKPRHIDDNTDNTDAYVSGRRTVVATARSGPATPVTPVPASAGDAAVAETSGRPSSAHKRPSSATSAIFDNIDLGRRLDPLSSAPRSSVTVRARRRAARVWRRLKTVPRRFRSLLHERWWRNWRDGMLVWTTVGYLSFSYVSAAYRPAFGSCVAVVWNVVSSLPHLLLSPMGLLLTRHSTSPSSTARRRRSRSVLDDPVTRIVLSPARRPTDGSKHHAFHHI